MKRTFWQLDAGTSPGTLQAILAEGGYRDRNGLTPDVSDHGAYYPCSVAGYGSVDAPPEWMTRLMGRLKATGIACELLKPGG